MLLGNVDTGQQYFYRQVVIVEETEKVAVKEQIEAQTAGIDRIEIDQHPVAVGSGRQQLGRQIGNIAGAIVAVDRTQHGKIRAVGMRHIFHHKFINGRAVARQRAQCDRQLVIAKGAPIQSAARHREAIAAYVLVLEVEVDEEEAVVIARAGFHHDIENVTTSAAAGRRFHFNGRATALTVAVANGDRAGRAVRARQHDVEGYVGVREKADVVVVEEQVETTALRIDRNEIDQKFQSVARHLQQLGRQIVYPAVALTIDRIDHCEIGAIGKIDVCHDKLPDRCTVAGKGAQGDRQLVIAEYAVIVAVAVYAEAVGTDILVLKIEVDEEHAVRGTGLRLDDEVEDLTGRLRRRHEADVVDDQLLSADQQRLDISRQGHIARNQGERSGDHIDGNIRNSQ